MKKDYLHVNEVEPQELLYILLEHFSQAEGTHKFQKPDTEHFLEVVSDETGKINDIQPSMNFPLSELEEIEKEIQVNLLFNHGTKIRQVIAFCGTKVAGYFRYKELFQVLPTPDDTPKVKYGIADQPFILEVAYQSCPNSMIEVSRWKEKVVLYTRLLNLFSDQTIFTGSRFARFGWGHPSDDPSNMNSEWIQLEYVYPGLKGSLDDFSSIENISPIERVPFQIYYTAYRGRYLSPLKIANTLEYSLDKAFSLNHSDWRKFFMACSWYAQYKHTWEESFSSAFIALVTALECLAQNKEVCKYCSQPILENEEDICRSCGQPRFRVTKHFQDFLKKYFPSIDHYPNEKKTLYQVRSQLAHGSDLLQADLEPWKYFFNKKSQEQDQLQRNLYYIVGIAIFNWLHSL